MMKGLIIVGLLSCTGSAVTTADSPPLIVGGAFGDDTNAELGLLVRGTGVNILEVTNIRIDLPLPDLGGGGDRDSFVLGLDCDAQAALVCGDPGLQCYSCTAYGESSSDPPKDVVEYGEEVVEASRCTAIIAAKDSSISGIVTDPRRGYKYQIRTLLSPKSIRDNAKQPGYGYEGIRVQDWNITVDKRVPEKPISDSIDLVGDHRALLAEENNTPKKKLRDLPRPLIKTNSKQNRRAEAKADDDGSTITLMYYLTKRAMCQWTNQEYATCVNDPTALVTMVGVITAYGNQALANSNVDYAYETVHIHVDEEHDEGTSATTNERLEWIAASETAAALRDKYGADLVVEVFYMAGNQAGGVGYVPEAFPARQLGFSSQGGLFTLMDHIITHEVGHNMGLNHNREEMEGGESDKSFYGYNNCDECFMTIMSYQTNCMAKGCESVVEIPYFSNVNEKYTNDKGTFVMGDAANDNSATLNLSKMGVAMNRFKAPHLLLEMKAPSFYAIEGLQYLVFSVIAKDNVEIDNIELTIGGAMAIELYTAIGSFEGNELDDAFWGDPHVTEDVTPMSDANPLFTSGFAAFESFPTLSLSKGSTTSFKIKHETTTHMQYSADYGMAAGDVYFENDHLQVLVGAFGTQDYVSTSSASLWGAFRYTLAKETTSPMASPSSPTTSVPTTSARAPTAPITSAPTVMSSKMPSGQQSMVPSDQQSKLPSEHPSKLPSDQPSKMPSDLPSDMPSKMILDQPSKLPSNQPSVMPSDQPSKTPSAQLSMPSDQPLKLPSDHPSKLPLEQPSKMPSGQQSMIPSDQQSKLPSEQPSKLLSDQPSKMPSDLASNLTSKLISDQPSKLPSNQPSVVLSDQPSKMPSAQLSEKPSKIAPVTSAPLTSAPKTSSPTISVPMTSVPTASVPTTSTPTVMSSIRSPHPTYDYSAYCEDALECSTISQLSTAEERKQECESMKWSKTGSTAKETCPIACGNLKCYKFTQACKDFETEQFTVLNQTQQCRWIKWMRVTEKNPLVPWICLSAAVPMNSSNVALDYSYLAQDRCQESCQNPACTCADRTFPFWTEGYDISDNMSMVDVLTHDAPARAFYCKDLYEMTTRFRDTVCELDIHGVTAHLSKPTNDIPAIIKVNYMCPKACGNRTECFCTDSTDMIRTPSRGNAERQCFWARDWSADKLAEFCDESIEPYFARACAITCKNPRCVEHDSTYSLELFGNVVSTTCHQISKFSQIAPLGKDEEYVRLMCGAMDYRKMLFTYELCPVACKDVDVSVPM